MTFNDHFSGHAELYAAFRPGYPLALFDWLASQSPGRRLAWDCATGNGQAARALQPFFERVIATDLSAAQVAAAEPCAGVEFRVAAAEASGLPAASVDLITVAQAMHWFDLEAFFAHAAEVLCRDGLLAAWSYELFSVDDTVDALVDTLYRDTLAGFWPPERSLVETGYEAVLPDWPRRATPPFEMVCDWRVEQVLGYLRSWSATQRHARATGGDAIAALAAPMQAAWGKGARRVRWPLNLYVLQRPS